MLSSCCRPWLVLALVACTVAADEPKLPSLDPTEDVKQASQRYADALLKQDRDALEQLVAPGFVSIGRAGGTKVSKESLIRGWMRETKIEGINRTRVEIRVSGDTAVEVGELTFIYKDDRRSPPGWYLNTWKKSDGRWRLIGAGHATFPERDE